jgi:hypothetical protein
MKRVYKTFYLMIFLAAAALYTSNLSAQVIIDKVTDTLAVVGEQYTYQMTATSFPDNEVYALEVGLEGMTINDPSPGIIKWVPTGISKGGKVVVRATNSDLETATIEFFLYVSSGVTCPSNVTAYWKLDETVSPYNDYKGTNDAVITAGDPIKDTVGIIGRAQVFTSTKDNQLHVPSNDIFNWGTDDDFSIEFWYNNQYDDMNEIQVLVGRNESSTGLHWWIGMDQSEKVNFYFRNPYGADIWDSVNSSSGYNTWYHVFLVRDAEAGTVRVYRNGVSSPVRTLEGYGLAASNVPLTIGWLKPGTGDSPGAKYQYDGRIDEVVIYNEAFTTAEVVQKYNNGLAHIPVCPSGNYAPVFRTTPLTSVNEESAYSYQYLATDVDGNPLTYTVVTKPAWLTHTPGTRTLSGTPSDNDVGTFPVQIKVNDGTVDIYHDFSITVINVNDKPELSNLETAALAYHEDDGEVAVTAAITVADVDDTNLDSARVWISANYTSSEDVLAFTNANGISGVWNATTGSLKLTGTSSVANYQAALRSVTYENTDNVDPSQLTRTVSFTANDGELNSIVRTRNITVTSVNDCPVISGHATLSTPEEDTIWIMLEYLTFTDEDDAPGSHSLTVASGSNYTFSGNIVTPAPDFEGTLNVNVKLSDSKCTVDYVLPVTVTGINDAPRFNFASLPTDAYEQQTYLLKIRAFDPDAGDVVSYSVTQKPAWLNVISDTILTGVPDFTNLGPNPVTIRISDGEVNVDTSFIITVHTTNYIPHITSTPATSVNEDELYIYNIVVVDTNSGDPLILTAPVLPGWLTLNTVQQTLTGTPTNAQVGTEASVDYQVKLKVSDGKQDSTQTFTITVINVNDAPEITGQADTIKTFTGHSDELKLSNLVVTDVDNLLTQLTLMVLPGTGYSISGNVITINTSTLGVLPINVRVSDGSLYDEGIYYVKVGEPTGTDDLTNQSGILKVYPNPAKEFIVFDFSATEDYNIEIIDITGRTIYKNHVSSNDTPLAINTSDMPNGLYFYKVYTNKNQFVGSIIIKN